MKSWHFYLTLREIFNRFWSVFISTSWPIFTHLLIDLAKMINMKVIDNVSSFPKCPRAQIYHAWARRFEEMKLGIHSWNTSHFVMNMRSNLHAMLHNPILQASKPSNLSIIRRLHMLLSYYSSVWAIVQMIFPFMAQRRHCHLHKASFMQCQLALSFAPVPFALASSTKSDKYV